MKKLLYIILLFLFLPPLCFGAATDHYVDLTFAGDGDAGTFIDPFGTETGSVYHFTTAEGPPPTAGTAPRGLEVRYLGGMDDGTLSNP